MGGRVGKHNCLKEDGVDPPGNSMRAKMVPNDIFWISCAFIDWTIFIMTMTVYLNGNQLLYLTVYLSGNQIFFVICQNNYYTAK